MQTSTVLLPPPRVTRLKKSTWKGRIIYWTLMILILVGGPFFMNRSLGRLRTLMDNGKKVTAKVVGSHEDQGKSTTYYLNVEYVIDSKPYGGQKEVDMDTYVHYKTASTIPVVTMPNDPGDYEVGSVNESTIDQTRDIWMLMLGLYGLFVSIFFLWAEFAVYNERSLLRKGESVFGEITAVKFMKGKATSTTVEYRYTTPLAERTSKDWKRGDCRSLFKEGDPILILYSHGNDKKCLPLPMFRFVELV